MWCNTKLLNWNAKPSQKLTWKVRTFWFTLLLVERFVLFVAKRIRRSLLTDQPATCISDRQGKYVIQTQWFCYLCVLRPWRIKIPKDAKSQSPKHFQINVGLVFLTGTVRRLESDVAPPKNKPLRARVTHWFWTESSWFFTRWVPGLTITIWNKITGNSCNNFCPNDGK